MDLFLPIKPKFVEQIKCGTKKYEFRKCLPHQQFRFLIIYSSSPIKKIVGYCTVKQIHYGEKENIWEKTKKFSGIEKQFFDSYYANVKIAVAYELENLHFLESHISPKEVDLNFKIPQSFCYTQDSFLEKVLKWKQS